MTQAFVGGDTQTLRRGGNTATTRCDWLVKVGKMCAKWEELKEGVKFYNTKRHNKHHQCD